MNILEEANKITSKDRQQMYGKPADKFRRIAASATFLLEKDVTAQDIVLILLLIKMSREVNKPKRDNRVDIAGYAWVLDELNKI